MGKKMISAVSRAKAKQLKCVIEDVLLLWNKEWFIDPICASVQFNEGLFCEIRPEGTDSVLGIGETDALVNYEQGQLSDIGHAALKAQDASLTAEECAFAKTLSIKILTNLLYRLTAHEFTQKHIDDPGVYQNTVTICLEGNHWRTRVHLNKACLEQVLTKYEINSELQKNKHVLCSARNVIADSPINVELRLQTQKIKMTDLINLQPGDIVPLQHRLDSPLQLSAEGHALPVAPFLVKSNGKKAFIIGEK